MKTSILLTLVSLLFFSCKKKIDTPSFADFVSGTYTNVWIHKESYGGAPYLDSFYTDNVTVDKVTDSIVIVNAFGYKEYLHYDSLFSARSSYTLVFSNWPGPQGMAADLTCQVLSDSMVYYKSYGGLGGGTHYYCSWKK